MAKKGKRGGAAKKAKSAPPADVNGEVESVAEESGAPKTPAKREASRNGVTQEPPAKKKRSAAAAPAEGVEPPKLRQRPKQLRERTPKENTTVVKTSKKTPAKAKKSAPKKKTPKKAVDYEVEKIIDVRHKKSGQKEFLVRWKGYNSSDDTWEPEKNLNCPSLIEEFNGKKEEEVPVTDE